MALFTAGNLMIGMFLSSAVAGTIFGGVGAAEKYCKMKTQTEQVKQQTQDYIKSSQELFDNYQFLDSFSRSNFS